MNLDAAIELRAFFGRFRGGRHDLDVMTSIGQDLRQVPDVNLLAPDNRWVELREHQDAHGTIRSYVSQRMKKAW